MRSKLLVVALMALTSLSTIAILRAAEEKKDTRLFELRIYTPNPGKMDALNARFRNHTTKLFEKHGMQNIGYWVDADNKKLYYILAFPDKEAQAKAWKDFQADPDWNKARTESERNGAILASRPESIMLKPTDYSAIK